MTFSLFAGERQIDLSSPVCMGIINATPDSFSDGSEFASAKVSHFVVDVTDRSVIGAPGVTNRVVIQVDIRGAIAMAQALAVGIAGICR